MTASCRIETSTFGSHSPKAPYSPCEGYILQPDKSKKLRIEETWLRRHVLNIRNSWSVLFCNGDRSRGDSGRKWAASDSRQCAGVAVDSVRRDGVIRRICGIGKLT